MAINVGPLGDDEITRAKKVIERADMRRALFEVIYRKAHGFDGTGPDRVPNLSDREIFQYLNSLLTEWP